MPPNQNDKNDDPYHLRSHEPALRDNQTSSQPPLDSVIDMSEPQTGKDKDSRHWWEKLSKKQWIIIGVVAAVLLIGLGTFIFLQLHHKPTKPAPTARKTLTGQPIVSPLTGVEVKQADRDRPVTGVMIENSPLARPQSGLKEGGVVFEAIAEYGITRFMTLYQEAQPANIGPIRSARPYYLDWLQGFDAPLAHVGGSPDALRQIKANNVKDLDQMANGNFYHRVSSREAPHNVYTSMEQLNRLEQDKGWFTTPNFTGFARKKDAASKQPNAKAIDFSIARDATYNVHYDYDTASNSYLRSEGGAPHMDAETKTQLAPKVVIALVMPYSLAADGYHSNYQTIGSGQAFVFQDGLVTDGTWTKGSPTEQLSLKDAAGKVIKLNAGQTWISAVSAANAVVAKP